MIGLIWFDSIPGVPLTGGCFQVHKIAQDWISWEKLMHSRWVNALNVQAPWGCLFATCFATRYYPTLALFWSFLHPVSAATRWARQQAQLFDSEALWRRQSQRTTALLATGLMMLHDAWWVRDYGIIYVRIFATMTTPHHSIAKKNLTWPWPCLVSIWNIAWLCLTDNNNCSLSNSATQCVLLSGHGLSALWQQDVHILLIRSRSIVFLWWCVFSFLMCVYVCVGRCSMRTHNMMNMHEYHKFWIQSSLFSDSTE